MSRPRLLTPVLRIGVALVVVALLVSLCAPAEAGRAPRRPLAVTDAPAVTQPTPAPASVAAVDPQTGRLGRPTAAQRQELSAAERTGLLQSAEGLTEVRRPDGSWMMDLQGRFQMYSFVGLGGPGALRLSGVDGGPAALRLPVAVPSATTVER